MERRVICFIATIFLVVFFLFNIRCSSSNSRSAKKQLNCLESQGAIDSEVPDPNEGVSSKNKNLEKDLEKEEEISKEEIVESEKINKLDEPIHEQGSLKTYIDCYRAVSKATYLYDLTYDEELGVVKENHIAGYGLMLNEETILSPAKNDKGELMFCVHTQHKTQIYDFPDPIIENRFFKFYNLKAKTHNRKVFPVSIVVPKANNMITMRFKVNKASGDSREIQKKLSCKIYIRELNYGIYLMSEKVSSGYKVIEGYDLSEEKSRKLLVGEINRRLNDILEYSKALGVNFLSLSEEVYRSPEADDEELTSKLLRLKIIGEALASCLNLPETKIQQTIAKMLKELGVIPITNSFGDFSGKAKAD